MTINFIKETIDGISWIVMKFDLPFEGIDHIAERFKHDDDTSYDGDILSLYFYSLRSVFHLRQKDLYEIKSCEEGLPSYTFLFADLSENGYYMVTKSILDTNHNVFIHQDIVIEERMFVAERNISIFSRIDKICNEDIFVGGSHQNAIPEEVFEVLLNKFPTSTEITLFAKSRISMILNEYFLTMTDAELKLQNYYKKKDKRLSGSSILKSKGKIPLGLYETEIEKYHGIKDILVENLQKDTYPDELHWQKLLEEFLLFIFPQYIAVFREVAIPDAFSKKHAITKRFIDFVLVNTEGYIDIIEIKVPCKNCILYRRESRGNFYPHRELSAAVMQAEKYLLYINSSVTYLEEKLTTRYKEQLPHGMEIKIRNPHAKIIMGRSNNFEDNQKSDFEVIKRQYSNIADIMSYDNILSYLENIINTLQKRKDNP